MVVSDPIADMLTRIRNGLMARHEFALIPNSKLKFAISKILKDEGFIRDFELLKDKNDKVIKLYPKYQEKKPVITGLERVSKPGLKVYVKRSEIPRVYGGLGVAILSTSKGVMTGYQAYKQGLGGELLCYVW